MSRIINRPVDVTMGPGGVPVAFRQLRDRYRVQAVLDCWVETGRWWEQETEQTTYRVATFGGGVYELTWNPAQKRWFLYKSYD